jgi:hypothetical protein
VPDLRLGHELESRLDHADAGAQDRHEPDLHREARSGVRSERRLDLARLGREVRGRFIEKERRDLADELAEDLRRGAFVAQTGDLLSDQGVGRDMELRAQRATSLKVRPSPA